MEKIYTVDEIANILNMHPKTIQRYIREGKLNATKVGKSWRVHKDDLELIIDRSTMEKSMNTKEVNQICSVSVSAVVDIQITNVDEGIHIINMLTAMLNSRNNTFQNSTMSSQFIQPENKVRVMLWGSTKFIEIVMSSIEQLIHNKEVK